MSRGDTKVFLGNLPPECRVRDIEGFFESHGRVRNVLIKQGKYGFAEFEDSREAEDAVCDLHGKKLLGSRVTVEFAKGPKKGDRRAPWVSKYGAPSRTKFGLKVFNLSSRVSWQDLKDMFRRAGQVCYAEAHTDRLHEGRVELETEEDLERVIRRYQGYEVNGRKLNLVDDIQETRDTSRATRSSSSTRDTRSGSRSKSSRRSRSHSRSKSISKSRSKSITREVDPDDQDVKRLRKRSNSGSNKGNKSSLSSHSRSVSRNSDSKSPNRKVPRVDRGSNSIYEGGE